MTIFWVNNDFLWLTGYRSTDRATPFVRQTWVYGQNDRDGNIEIAKEARTK